MASVSRRRLQQEESSSGGVVRSHLHPCTYSYTVTGGMCDLTL